MKSFNKDIGSLGEEISENHLRNLGYNILDKNYRSKCGEIDLIAFYLGYICFIEVKTRYSKTYGVPAESVSLSKQKKIHKTAMFYIMNKNILNSNFRFDVIEVLLNTYNTDFLINHIEDAFQL